MNELFVRHPDSEAPDLPLSNLTRSEEIEPANMMEETDMTDELPVMAAAAAIRQNNRKTKIRNLVAFWLLGLCNNYAYVIMLSAAYDILEKKETETESDVEPPDTMYNLTNSTSAGRFDCNPISTGAVLLADILPTLIIKLTAPWFADYIPYGVRIAICVLAAASSFLIVSFVHVVALSLMGVVFASVSAGLGEFTYVSLMSFYDKNVVSTWSSGTGAAGLIGALSYAGLTEILTPRDSLLVMLIVPVAMVISYWGILVRAPTLQPHRDDQPVDEARRRLIECEPTEGVDDLDQDIKMAAKEHLMLKERIYHIKHLLKYMIPLMLVYFAEYFINQGLLELIYFQGVWLDHQGQYRWFQVLYQLGVFISRSSVNFVKFKRLWIFSLLQWGVLVLMFTVAYYAYMPSIAIVFAIILFEGLLGGAAYVNTFYQIRENESPKYKEFAMGTTTVAESMGTSLAGAVALPVHNALCRL
ncbi:battenin-like isoform X1 [Patiria miniata]|uniref:Battenin n=1 Tax=Patiria miniata TaxID=46514 RepID=A0A914AYF4_PATMI|nr:battenin-like isoform X1 [Patiria miniata]